MSIRYRGTGSGLVLIDAFDGTPAFLNSKLVTTINLTKTILNPGGNEQLQLDVNLAGAGGLDTRYVKRSPSTENQTILPLTDNIPLTIQGFAGGLADLFDVKDGAGNIVASVDRLGTSKFQSSSNVSLIVIAATAFVDAFEAKTLGGVLDFSIGPTGSTTIRTSNDLNILNLDGSNLVTSRLIRGFSTSVTGNILVFDITGQGGVTMTAASDVVPLTVNSFIGATSSLAALLGSTGSLVFKIGPGGATTITPSSGTGLTLQQAAAGGNMLDTQTSGGTSVFQVVSGGSTKARGKNVLVVENLDEVQASATVPAVDTALKSYVLGANSYTDVIVEGEGYVSVTALSTVQDINIKARTGVLQIGVTMIVHPGTAVVSKIPFSIKASVATPGAVTLSVAISAAAADANTTVFLNSLRIFGEV